MNYLFLVSLLFVLSNAKFHASKRNRRNKGTFNDDYVSLKKCLYEKKGCYEGIFRYGRISCLNENRAYFSGFSEKELGFICHKLYEPSDVTYYWLGVFKRTLFAIDKNTDNTVEGWMDKTHRRIDVFFNEDSAIAYFTQLFNPDL